MEQDHWKCPVCGRAKGDMQMQGNGLMKCAGCGSLLLVDYFGRLHIVKENKQGG